jgi:hypothetical protein
MGKNILTETWHCGSDVENVYGYVDTIVAAGAWLS